MITRTSLGLAVALSGCDLSQSCTEIGCLNGFAWSFDAPVSSDALQSARIEACRNESCVSGAAIRDAPEPGVGTGITLMNAAGDRVEVTVWSTGGERAELDVHWPLRQEQARDGDVYRVKLSDGAGALLLERSHTVARYDEHYPNGKECDEVPCRSASLDERAAADD